MGGARAWGIKVPRARLLELLPARHARTSERSGAGKWTPPILQAMKKMFPARRQGAR